MSGGGPQPTTFTGKSLRTEPEQITCVPGVYEKVRSNRDSTTNSLPNFFFARMRSTMSTDSNPDPGRERQRHHHSEPTGWKAVPKLVKLIGAICLCLLILIPIGKDQGWFKRATVVKEPVAVTKAFNPGLEVIEAHFEPRTRVITGSVRNTSGQVYQDVRVSYDIRDRRGIEAGIVEAAIPQVAPKQTAVFRTNPLSAQGVMWALREISGDPR